jgi:hypothetical protein
VEALVGAAACTAGQPGHEALLTRLTEVCQRIGATLLPFEQALLST